MYPLGPASPETRANYSEEKTEISAQALFSPVSFIRLGAGTAFESFQTAGAGGTRFPSVDELFSAPDMPFFLMPDLGGSRELRGFSNSRFRDRHSIMATAEFRWLRKVQSRFKVQPVRNTLRHGSGSGWSAGFEPVEPL